MANKEGGLNMTDWDYFFHKKLTHIFSVKYEILDIGGGLRVLEGKGNVHDKSREWLLPYIKKVNYKILDPTVLYNPDIVGDIHSLPLANKSIDAILCIAVFEHIENPFIAINEIYRALKDDGCCFVYLPFLYPYHAEDGYYKDYWRYTEDSIRLLCKQFSVIEIQRVRYPLETLVNLSPFGKINIFIKIARLLDLLLKKKVSKQTSGYNVFLEK